MLPHNPNMLYRIMSTNVFVGVALVLFSVDQNVDLVVPIMQRVHHHTSNSHYERFSRHLQRGEPPTVYSRDIMLEEIVTFISKC